MFDWMPHLPDAVWGAVVGAGIALLTTFLNNRHSRKQLRMQLADNALQRDRDRAMALRRDVYLPAVEAVTRMQATLGRLLDIEADQSKIGRQVSVDQSILAKVHLVASESTVRALMAYQGAFMPVYIEIIMLRAPLLVHKAGLETHQEYIDRAETENQRIVQLMKQLNIEGNTDKAAFDRLNAQSAIEFQTLKTHSDKQAALRLEMFSGQMQLGDRMVEAIGKPAALIATALISCRQELELPIDPIEYRRLVDEQQNAAREALREALRSARKLAGIEQTPRA
jgi:hypothetical protein